MIIPAGTKQEVGMASGRSIDFSLEYTLNSGTGSWEAMCFSVPRASRHTAGRYRELGNEARSNLRNALSAEMASADAERAATIQAALDGDNFTTMCAVLGEDPDCPATLEDDGATVTVTGDPPEGQRIAVVRLFWNAETETDLDLGRVAAGGS